MSHRLRGVAVWEQLIARPTVVGKNTLKKGRFRLAVI